MAAPARIAVFPGSFDPLTVGHLDLIDRSARFADRVVVAVLRNTGKRALFSLDDRLSMLREVFAGRPEIEVASFDGLLVDFARSRKASLVIRGVRSAADLDYERQMALTNRHLDPALDTILLMPSAAVGHVSSSLVREIASMGGPVSGLVPPAVENWIARRPHAQETGKV